MLSAVQCDSLISLKGAFHNEGSIGAFKSLEKMHRIKIPVQGLYYSMNSAAGNVLLLYLFCKSREYSSDSDVYCAVLRQPLPESSCTAS